MDDKQLKPCPFCGMVSENALLHKGDCFFSYLNKGEFDEAFEHWNTRLIEDKLQAEVERLTADLMRECPWTYDQGYDVWHTGCDNDFQIIAGTPAENNFSFCPYCGGKMVAKKAVNNDG